MSNTISSVELLHYTDPDGRDSVADWLNGLRDRRAVARIAVRLERLELGLFGDCKTVRGKSGISELRIDYGPGYRVYFARTGKAEVLLLCGGDKRSQHADIEEAKARLKNWNLRP